MGDVDGIVWMLSVGMLLVFALGSSAWVRWLYFDDSMIYFIHFMMNNVFLKLRFVKYCCDINLAPANFQGAFSLGIRDDDWRFGSCISFLNCSRNKQGTGFERVKTGHSIH